jgi:ribose transport system permease protein
MDGNVGKIEQTESLNTAELSPENEAEQRSATRSLLGRLSAFAPAFILLALLLLVGLIERGFLEPSNLRVVFEGTTPILLLALGQTFVILIGGIDLSNAALASLCGVLVALLLPGAGPLAVIIVLLFGLFAGSIQGAVHDIGQIPSLIVTLIGLSVWSGLALSITDGQTIRPTEGMDTINWLGERAVGISSGLVMALVLVGLTAVLLNRTVLGRRIYAVGSSQLVALLSGVPVRQVRIAAFGLSGLFAAIAGLVLLADLGSASPTVAHSLLLPSLVAVLLGGNSAGGGRGGAWNTLIGVLILGVLRVAFNAMGINPSVHQLLFGVIVLISLALSVDRGQRRRG